MTSFQPLPLHVDRGLERHGNPWVPTDQGPKGPCQVDPTCKWARRPRDSRFYRGVPRNSTVKLSEGLAKTRH
jgi:hypothetical protein